MIKLTEDIINDMFKFLEKFGSGTSLKLLEEQNKTAHGLSCAEYVDIVNLYGRTGHQRNTVDSFLNQHCLEDVIDYRR